VGGKKILKQTLMKDCDDVDHCSFTWLRIMEKELSGSMKGEEFLYHLSDYSPWR
jgi:hypothetical protein